MADVVAPLHAFFDNVLVWDNSVRENLQVYGRYAALDEVADELVYVQDDDIIAEPESLQALVRAYDWAESENTLVCNVPERFRKYYSDFAIVGLGAIFRRSDAWTIFDALELDTTWKHRYCDLIFTGLHRPQVWVDLGYTELPYASAPDRMWKEPNHVSDHEAVKAWVRSIRSRDN